MFVETKSLRQCAVLWPFIGNDGVGEPTFDTSIQIKVRWEESDNESTGENQNPVATGDTIYVDRVIPINSQIWLGSQSEYTKQTDSEEDLKLVVSRTNTPDIKGKKRQRTVQVINKYGSTN